ncbi:triple tyrosine motif-containing protein [Psychrobacillus sp. NPDC096426]|uniref:triple tyrosine motif-containing protein n=1 Tax=Psychrobacillus sp. NPDC096426 TaxID=3364491 RepID=UPI00381E63AF
MKNIAHSLFLFIFVLFTLVLLEPEKIALAAGGPVNIGFNPYDTAVDPDKPVVYMTEKGSKTIQAVNYETGVIKTLTLPYPAERLELYNQNLYVTQLKMKHDSYNFGPHEGGIAEVDTEKFTLNSVMHIDEDPYDIAIDQNGFIYITPGSDQHGSIKVYSLVNKTKVDNEKNIYVSPFSMIYYNKEASKLYTISSKVNPRDIYAYEINNGIIIKQYNSPYHGDYRLNPTANISPDGLQVYNHSGVVFDLAEKQPGDMVYKFEFDREYKDFEFSLKDQLTFAVSNSGGIDVYTYNTTNYLYTLKKNRLVEKLHYRNGLISIYSDSNNNYFLEFVENYNKEVFSAQTALYRKHLGNNDMRELTTGTKNIPINSFFQVVYNETITLNDKAEITLKGPDGFVRVDTTINREVLTIRPEYLQEYATYTLSIGNGALTNSIGEKLPAKQDIQFQTMAPSITSLSVTKDQTSRLPLEYVFTANAVGGVNPQYQFLINEDGKWKVLQKYGPANSLVWRPVEIGPYEFKVMARSEDSEEKSEKEHEFWWQVLDMDPPIADLKAVKNASKNNMNITITAKDNLGIKTIILPNGVKVNDSKASYTVNKNGTYLFVIEDVTGNVITKSLEVTDLDNVKPKVIITKSSYAKTKSNVIITVNIPDKTMVRSIKLPNGTYVNRSTVFFSVSKNGVYKFEIEDDAGNIWTESITVKNIH